jgi:hypothetical protein
MATEPKSGAVLESLCATAGMLVATWVGFKIVPACYAHGWLLTAVGFAASVALMFVLMIVRSVLGNYLGSL